MDLLELQKILGNQISSILDLDDRSSEKFQTEMEKSYMISKLAKQMINNADVILRTDKFTAEHPSFSTHIKDVVNNVK